MQQSLVKTSLVFVLFSLSCATDQTSMEMDRSDPRYQSGGLAKPRSPYRFSIDEGNDGRADITGGPTDLRTGQAIGYGVVAGVNALFRGHRYYRKSGIRGLCEVGDEASEPSFLPCSHFMLKLQSRKPGHGWNDVTQVRTNGAGEFRLPADSSELEYRVVSASEGYDLAKDNGESVPSGTHQYFLRLVPR